MTSATSIDIFWKLTSGYSISMILVKGYGGKLGLCDGLGGALNGSVGFFTRIGEDNDILC